jgi:hypothetical protein
MSHSDDKMGAESERSTNSDDKIGAKCEHSAVGKLPKRWLIFDDPSLLRLGNISRSASTPKAENENS